MELIWEMTKFIAFSLGIVAISKYILVTVLRKFAESLKLKPKTVGNFAGIATSMPELLSVTFASFAGLIDASIYNIISSNIINLAQYGLAIILNKNGKVLKNTALKIDLIMVVITILIPVGLLLANIEVNISIVPIFVLLLLLCYKINSNAHKVHLEKELKQEEKIILEEEKNFNKPYTAAKYLLYLLLTGVLLFFIGNLLSNTLENLCLQFGIPQFIVGIALGFITSLPELITFFESQKHYKIQENDKLGVVEATNNLLTSNLLNLFFIQSIGILIYYIIN